jgi:hypothetical protein
MDVRLVFLFGPRCGTTFEVPGGELLIGRSPACGLRIEDAAAVVSSRHAVMYRRDGRVFVRDAGSLNGTYVDGRPVSESEVRPGQVLTFGPEGPSVRVEYSALGREAARGAPAASGLTQLYRVARSQSAAVAGGAPSQTAVIKTFVKLAQERSTRRQKVLLALTAVAGLAAVAAVLVWGERRAVALRTELTLVTTELGQLSASAADWQQTAAALAEDLKSSQAEIEKQRRQLEAQRLAVHKDGRFGPAVTERFASGVGLIQVRVGWHNADHGWLRLRGTPDGRLTFTTTEGDHLALYTVTQCTGFLIDRAGWVLTNRHCLDLAYPSDQLVRNGRMELKGSRGAIAFTPAVAGVRVSFPPGRVYDGDQRSIQISQEHDLGIFRTTSGPDGVPVLPLARGAAQRIAAGEDIVMLAYPGGTDVTARRRGLGSFVDSSLRDQIARARAERAALFIRTSGSGQFLERVGPLPREAAKLAALRRSNLPLDVLLSTRSVVSSEAAFDALSRAGQVQPDVSGRMSVSGVRPTSISFHTLSGIGGASGAPVISTNLVVVGVHYAGFGESDRGSHFQQNDAVPVEYAWRFLPPEARP